MASSYYSNLRTLQNNKNELIENAESVIANIIHSNDADCSSVISWDNEFFVQFKKLLHYTIMNLEDSHQHQNSLLP